MQWIQRIERNGTRLTPVYVNEHGVETLGGLGDWRAAFERRATKGGTHLVNFDLRDLAPVAATEYAVGIGLEHASPLGHEVYETHLDGKRILIPTVVLLAALVGWLRGLGDWLLLPGTLDQLAAPVFDEEGKATVLVDRKSRITGNASDESLQARLLWLTTFPSGRRLWASVYKKATEGQMGVELPAARVDATLNGRVISGTLYVYRLSVKTLRPMEAPLPFAEHLAGASFCFDRHHTRGRAMLAYLAAARVHPSVTSEPELSKRPAGWHMSREEWKAVLANLKAAGFTTPKTVKPTIDLALKKYGAGIPWAALGEKGDCVKATVSQWRRRGKWDIVLDTLKTFRETGEAADSLEFEGTDDAVE